MKKLGSLAENEQIIQGECPSCNEQSEFTYLGVQEGLDKNHPLYNCQSCKSTMTLRYIRDYNEEV